MKNLISDLQLNDDDRVTTVRIIDAKSKFNLIEPHFMVKTDNNPY